MSQAEYDELKLTSVVLQEGFVKEERTNLQTVKK